MVGGTIVVDTVFLLVVSIILVDGMVELGVEVISVLDETFKVVM